MKVSELETKFRSDAVDQVRPYLFPSDDFLLWLNQAERQAALRGNLLYEADDDEICSFNISAGDDAPIALDPRVLRVVKAIFTPTGEDPVELCLIDRVELDRVRPGWRYKTEAVSDLIVDDTKMRFGCIPEAAGELRIECYRYPMEPMGENDDPEIGAPAHEHLVDWCLFQAFSQPESITIDLQRAARAEAAFTAYFGAEPDANRRQATEVNRPQHNVAVW